MKAIIIPKNNYNGVKVSQLIELYVDDSEYDAIEAAQTTNKKKYVDLIAQVVKRHLNQYGYKMGNCSEREKDVSYTDCLNCGLIKCVGSMSKWEACRRGNITYAYPTKVLPKTIKDPKIIEKLKPTREELVQERNMHIIDP
jgi:hypothetical protein